MTYEGNKKHSLLTFMLTNVLITTFSYNGIIVLQKIKGVEAAMQGDKKDEQNATNDRNQACNTNNSTKLDDLSMKISKRREVFFAEFNKVTIIHVNEIANENKGLAIQKGVENIFAGFPKIIFIILQTLDENEKTDFAKCKLIARNFNARLSTIFADTNIYSTRETIGYGDKFYVTVCQSGCNLDNIEFIPYVHMDVQPEHVIKSTMLIFNKYGWIGYAKCIYP